VQVQRALSLSGVSPERYHVRQNDSGISGIMLIDRAQQRRLIGGGGGGGRLIRHAAICTSVTMKVQFAAPVYGQYLSNR